VNPKPPLRRYRAKLPNKALSATSLTKLKRRLLGICDEPSRSLWLMFRDDTVSWLILEPTSCGAGYSHCASRAIGDVVAGPVLQTYVAANAYALACGDRASWL
jgi:hypothetical protein